MKKAINILIILASIVSIFGFTSLTKADNKVVLSLSPNQARTVIGGDELLVDVNLVSSSSSVAGIEININYPYGRMRFDSISYSDLLDVVLYEDINREVGSIHIEVAKLGGLQAPISDKVCILHFSAVTLGDASFSFGPVLGYDSSGNRLGIGTSGKTVEVISQQTNTNTQPEATVPTQPPVSPAPVVITPTETPTNSAVELSSPAPTVARSTKATMQSTETTTQTPSSLNYNTTSQISIDPKKTKITFDKKTALPDEFDKVIVKIEIRDGRNEIITKYKPTLISEDTTVTEPILIDNVWTSEISSNLSGQKIVRIKANKILLSNEMINFESPINLKTEDDTGSGINLKNIAPLNIIGKVSIQRKLDFFTRSITDKDTIKISGTAEPNSKIRLYIHSNTTSKEIQVKDDGSWNVVLDQPLEPGDHTVTAAVVDDNGYESKTKLIAEFEMKRSYFWQFLIGSIVFIFAVAILALVLIRKKLEKIKGNETPNPTGLTVLASDDASSQLPQTLRANDSDNNGSELTLYTAQNNQPEEIVPDST